MENTKKLNISGTQESNYSSGITIEFPDGSKKDFDKGVTGLDIAKSIGERLAMAALGIEVDGKIKDITSRIENNAKIRILTFKDKEGKDIFWHSASHLMTQAILRIFKDQDIGLGVGMPIEQGFYQDYDMKEIHEEDLEKIEKEMQKIVDEKLEISHKDIPKKQALDFYKKDPYKIELTNAVPGDNVSMYTQGEFDNLCKGPHVPNTSYIKAFKLTKIAGAYWRGKSDNKMLTRIYGVAFPDKKELKSYLTLLEEAEKRDHRKLGKELELFSIHDEGPGFPFFLPKGMVIKNELVNFWRREHEKAGYVEIQTPIILNRALWERSGHWMNYRENMYTTQIDKEDFAIKPMNCPGGMLVYNEKVHSYKELPMRVGELGIVHRHEMSGVLAGLFRVRVFTQDDAHIFMTEEQIKPEIMDLMDLFKRFYNLFGFDYSVELSTRPEKSIGTDEQWEFTTAQLKAALDAKGVEYKINEGDGAFYGPKIDFHLKDCIGRTWQCGTIQLDMSLPERFDLTYMGKDGTQKHRPFMIHRVVYGSLERFMGILIEHYAGKFPLWLSPVQARLMTVADRFEDYAKKIKDMFFDKGLRIEIDNRSESINKKVREAQMEKVPIMITIGEKEVEADSLAVRTIDGKVKFGVKPEDLMAKMLEAIEKKENVFKIE
ncbi:MAG: threonine--tRNA ligase [Nanoarchaeota archaeon]|nr:threonine--tRNA ligase [Nanoarchaeota archaeon]